MKKWIATLTTMVMTMSLLAGCGGSSATATPKVETDDKLSVVTTIFPIYDWTKEILGENLENVDLTMLMNNGVDFHSYQAITNDMIAIAECDLFIYVGGESDTWVPAALANATNPDMQVINLMDVLGDSVKVEELVEGMEETEHAHSHAEDEEDHDHDHEEEDHVHAEGEEHDHEEDHVHVEGEEHDHDHEEESVIEEEHDHDHEDEDEAVVAEEDHDHNHAEEGELDEHVWLSLQNAEMICKAITEALTSLDAENADTYTANLEAYVAQLQELDAEYEAVVAAGTQNTILFGDRFPFRYLVDDYGLEYYAAFVGCSAETEASFETIAFLAGKVDELQLSTVMTIEGTTHKIAETVVASTQTKDQTVLSVNSMQSVAASDIADGKTYLSIMEENLQVLTEALA
ncbi:metal ABC transporter substrate-binding protein [Chakrabartyella piscis]|uniref:metal ABC transporter substrate-binding protein n=1 Tax=Chakrabartyella piscis TaxID=2918914 RepID=UPI002958D15E|nr:metal ABC transporter substrate-binding protein [Chakrabartyella piscis]